MGLSQLLSVLCALGCIPGVHTCDCSCKAGTEEGIPLGGSHAAPLLISLGPSMLFLEVGVLHGGWSSEAQPACPLCSTWDKAITRMLMGKVEATGAGEKTPLY